MLALTKEDVGFENNQISITNTYYKTERRDIITTPKTEQSVRVIDIPQFLAKEIEMYVNRCYGLPDNERLFPIVAEGWRKVTDKNGFRKLPENVSTPFEETKE